MSDLEIVTTPVEALRPYSKNARTHSDDQIAQLVGSIQEYGFINPILIDEDAVIIAGHGRLEAAMLAGMDAVPTITIAGLTEEQRRAYVIADNKLALNAEWDFNMLKDELQQLGELDFDLDMTGFTAAEIAALLDEDPTKDDARDRAGNLSNAFGVPPFSILNSCTGWWRDRKNVWMNLGIQSELGREQLADTSFSRPDWVEARGSDTGGSVFDPVLCELIYRWFSPQGGTVLDPFAGGSVRGVVAAALGRDYVGVELRDEQVAANRLQWAAIKPALQAPDNPRKVISDPDALTPIEQRGEVWFKRDDLFEVAGAPGGKVRTCLALAKAGIADGKEGLVTAGSRASPQVNIVARVASHLGVQARCHTPQGELAPEVISAVNIGAEIVQHKAGYNNVIIKRARDDAKERNWVEIPFGMECLEAINQTRKQVADIPDGVQRIVMPVGSGMSLAGVLWGLEDVGLDIPVLGIVVGADPKFRLDEYAPDGWRDRVTLLQTGTDYHTPAERTALEGLELDAHYEAKCINHVQPGDLFWVVGIRQTAIPNDVGAGDIEWHAGDSSVVLPTLDTTADLIFSCPPYADLEVYSDDKRDISNMEYADFLRVYREIIAHSAAHLRDDSFACFVVSEVRAPDGVYRNFVADTVQAFIDAGLDYYNEGILVTPRGTAPIRAARPFKSGRKLCRVHQNVLIFCKGSPQVAAERLGEVQFGELTDYAPDEELELGADGAGA